MATAAWNLAVEEENNMHTKSECFEEKELR